jgi:hypothetical protein
MYEHRSFKPMQDPEESEKPISLREDDMYYQSAQIYDNLKCKNVFEGDAIGEKDADCQFVPSGEMGRMNPAMPACA